MEGTEILTTAQMRALESAAMDSGAVAGLDLMERAGAAVAGHIRLRWPKAGRVCVLCGPGNNGGDGYVIARYLARAGWDVRLLGMGAGSPDAAEMRRRWDGPVLPLDYDTFRALPDCDVYVDAIFGTGLTRPVEGEIAEIIRYIGGSGGDRAFFQPRLVAVDCPSGLCMDSGRFLGQRGSSDVDPRARLTVAFDSPKPGHLIGLGPDLCGELVIADIGLHPWRTPSHLLFINIPAGGKNLLRKHGGHKFTHGHALIVSGGIAQGGAARLAARGALRVGAGLVTLAPPCASLIEAGGPDALMRRGVDDADALNELLADKRITAICLGPGCGVDRAAALLPAALDSRRPLVLDADAITAWAQVGLPLHDNCVLTPHAGEFARAFPDLAEQWQGPQPPEPFPKDPAKWQAAMAASQAYLKALTEERGPAYSKLDAAREAAARCKATVLLKGPDTVIAAPDGRAIIHSAFDIPWLATAGAGDVLAGIIAGLLARGMPPLDAAATGALIHAQAARRFGPGLIADDLPDQIPGVFRDMNL